jgi:Calcineurin-like phosphoesterase
MIGEAAFLMPISVQRDNDHVVAIGDLHGNYQGFVRILQYLDLIDAGGHWIAPGRHLVQLGDVLGRGGEPGKIYALLHQLEGEAAEQGGGVHLVLGNHEILSVRGTLVYNTPAEFQDIADWGPASFGPAESITASRDWTPVPADTEKYEKRLAMMGCDIFQRYLHPRGPIGEWLLSHPSALILGDTLFVHGGLNRHHGLMDLESLNREVREEVLSTSQGRKMALHLVKDGPQWNREFTVSWSKSREAELHDVLDYHGCKRMVVGHTPTGSIAPLRTGEILPLYDEKLWCVDTGIGSAYGSHLSALCVEGDRLSAAYP